MTNPTGTKGTTEKGTPKIKTPKTPATAEVKCVDCGKIRVVGKGEVFQVKRCVECQESHRKALRKAYRKNRIANLRARVGLLEDLLMRNNIDIPVDAS